MSSESFSQLVGDADAKLLLEMSVKLLLQLGERLVVMSRRAFGARSRCIDCIVN